MCECVWAHVWVDVCVVRLFVCVHVWARVRVCVCVCVCVGAWVWVHACVI